MQLNSAVLWAPTQILKGYRKLQTVRHVPEVTSVMPMHRLTTQTSVLQGEKFKIIQLVQKRWKETHKSTKIWSSNTHWQYFQEKLRFYNIDLMLSLLIRSGLVAKWLVLHEFCFLGSIVVSLLNHPHPTKTTMQTSVLPVTTVHYRHLSQRNVHEEPTHRPPSSRLRLNVLTVLQVCSCWCTHLSLNDTLYNGQPVSQNKL